MVESLTALAKIQEIRELLTSKPGREFLCGTEKIQYFDYLADICLKKCAEIPNNETDTLLTYLKETLTKLQREEFTYNQQAALSLCQVILERGQENRVTNH